MATIYIIFTTSHPLKVIADNATVKVMPLHRNMLNNWEHNVVSLMNENISIEKIHEHYTYQALTTENNFKNAINSQGKLFLYSRNNDPNNLKYEKFEVKEIYLQIR